MEWIYNSIIKIIEAHMCLIQNTYTIDQIYYSAFFSIFVYSEFTARLSIHHYYENPRLSKTLKKNQNILINELNLFAGQASKTCI